MQLKGNAFGIFSLAAQAATLAVLVGCGAPGLPVPPAPRLAAPITDLAARQDGDGVQLTFTLPTKNVMGDRLSASPAVEIFRGDVRADGSPDLKSFHLDYTVPGSLVHGYIKQGRFQFVDPISPADVRANPGKTLAFLVRTRLSAKHASADSNLVSLRTLPVPDRIASMEVRVTETAVELSWQAPSKTSGGEPLGPISEYRIYRGELVPGSAQAATKDLSQARWIVPPALLASSVSTTYRDTDFAFGKRYLYTVRTVVMADGKQLESSPSAPAIVTPKDVFPPAVPLGLVASVLSGAPGSANEVDLSWSINSETDLAGYRIYRSEQAAEPGTLLTPELLLSPAYRDTSVEPGHRYWYTVTSVDRAGNESAPSVAVSADLTQPST